MWFFTCKIRFIKWNHYLINFAGLPTYNPCFSIDFITTVPAPNWVLLVIVILSIIVAFIPKIHCSSTFTNPAIATLGYKKLCEPITESCAIVQLIFKIQFSLTSVLASKFTFG